VIVRTCSRSRDRRKCRGRTVHLREMELGRSGCTSFVVREVDHLAETEVAVD